TSLTVDLRHAPSERAEPLKTKGAVQFAQDEEETLHQALKASLDGMTGACSRLRGEDVVSVIENGELTVLGFAPPLSAVEKQKEIAASLKRSSEIASAIMTMEAVDEEMQERSAREEETRDTELQQRLADKEMEILSLRQALQEEQEARSAAEAKMREARSTLRVRDELLRSKNEELSNLHIELHSVAREHCSLQLRFRRLEESRQEDVTDTSSELLFLRRQCKLLEEMNQQLRDQHHAASAKPVLLHKEEREVPTEPVVPAEPVARDASKESTMSTKEEGRIGSHGSPGPLPSISRAAVRAMS
ncbi:unnamed protein product, partial [Symbiodinium pilosum]